MKIFLAALVIVSVSGCASTEWLTVDQNSKWTAYDPCISCGEKWDQIPNSPFEAQKRRANGERW